jgi:hypothetical protein
MANIAIDERLDGELEVGAAWEDKRSGAGGGGEEEMRSGGEVAITDPLLCTFQTSSSVSSWSSELLVDAGLFILSSSKMVSCT